METLTVVLLSLVAALLGTLLTLVVASVAAGGWWFYHEQKRIKAEQKKLSELVGRTWTMGDRQAQQLEKELAAQDLSGSLSRSPKRYAP